MNTNESRKLICKSAPRWATVGILVWVLIGPIQPGHSQAVQYAFTNLAGIPGGAGNADGVGSAARFRLRSFDENVLVGVAADSAGNVYVADRFNHTIRKVTPDGVVTTLAGSAGLVGNSDGTGSAARFAQPSGVAVDTAGNAYVADTFNHTIRKVTRDGVVTTLAGNPFITGDFGQPLGGYSDGMGRAARFDQPSGIALDSAGNIYVAEAGNKTIRKVTLIGMVTTVAGSAGQSGNDDGTGIAARFERPEGVAADNVGNLYVADSGSIRKVTANGVVTTFLEEGLILGLAVDSQGTLYWADERSNTILKRTPAGAVTTLAGGEQGYLNGSGSGAQFAYPSGLAVDGTGNIYVADTINAAIRKVTQDGVTTTLAGPAGQWGSADGAGSAARFNWPKGVAVDMAGNIYVSDTFNHTIRKVTPGGVVTNLAGSPSRFLFPSRVAIDSASNLYVVEEANYTVWKLTPDGVLTALAGSADQSGSAVAVDNGDNIYVVGPIIRKITPEEVVTTLAGAARFEAPSSMAVDGAGNIYVADRNAIRKITSEGVITTLAGGEEGYLDGLGNIAQFNSPQGIAVDSVGNVYVADTDNHAIRKVTPDGTVMTIAGTPGIIGGADGIGPGAQFSAPIGIAVDSSGNLYVTDPHRITKGTAYPTFTDLRISGGTLEATLAGLRAGATVVLESSTNLRDWLPMQSNVVTGSISQISRRIDLSAPAEFLRAVVK